MPVKDLSVAVGTLTDAATVTVDASLGTHLRLTAAGDRTLAAPTNAVDASKRIIEITASAAQRIITLTTGSSGSYELTVGVASPFTIPSGKTLFLGMIYSSSRARWSVLAARVLT